MAIIATNRIKTNDGVEIVLNFHRDANNDSVTMTIYSKGFHGTVFLSPDDCINLEDALDRTNSEYDEDDVVPEETARDRFIENTTKGD